MKKIVTTYRQGIKFEDGAGGSFTIDVYPDKSISISQSGGHFSLELNKWQTNKIKYLATELVKIADFDYENIPEELENEL